MPHLSVKIPAAKARQYEILIQPHCLYSIKKWLPKKSFTKIVIITDKKVNQIVGKNLAKLLRQANYDVVVITIPVGEGSKSYACYQKVMKTLAQHQCARDTLCLALGGGVVGDLAGFVAATYMRGVPYIQIPTTLLAMVDSSVGGKTAINSAYGKNIIGAFYSPLAVVMDTALLEKLPKRHLLNGLFEALKMFLTSNRTDFNYFAKNINELNENFLQSIIYRAIKIKARIVSRDEKESGERVVLNFGHTIGHAIETIENYKVSHGFAVALGILVESKIAELLGLLGSQDFQLIQILLFKMDVKGNQLKKYSIPKLIAATYQDKKVKLGKVHYVLLTAIGKVYCDKNNWSHPVTDNIVKKALHLMSEQ